VWRGEILKNQRVEKKKEEKSNDRKTNLNPARVLRVISDAALLRKVVV